jgi:hypothetical protein
MLARFSRSVMDSGGRTRDVHPDLQIVRRILACLTFGFNAPGVHAGSGREYRPHPIARHEFGAG